jgi:hypothetical protein
LLFIADWRTPIAAVFFAGVTQSEIGNPQSAIRNLKNGLPSAHRKVPQTFRRG